MNFSAIYDGSLNEVHLNLFDSDTTWITTKQIRPLQGYYDVYIAEFMLNDIGYYIKSENLTQEEFVNVLLPIVK